MGRPRGRAMAMTMPPLAGPSSLVSTMPVTPADWVNWRAWARPFWPVVASSTSKTSWGAPGTTLAAVRFIFSSSAIRFDLVCSRPAVSTSTASAPRALGGVRGAKAAGGGAGPGLLPQQLGLQALGPNLELLAGRGAEGVGGAEDDAAAFALPAAGQLGDGGGLAAAVHPDEESDVGLSGGRGGPVIGGAEQSRELFAQRAPQRRRLRQIFALHALAQALQELGGGFDAEVGAEQDGFELGEDLRGDFFPPAQGVVHALDELPPRAADRLPQASPPGAAFHFGHHIPLCLF